MALYFHIVELDNGRWACRHGNHEYDQHETLEQASGHIRLLATEQRPASIFAHRCDGAVDHIADV
ncbi:MAG TPA: hypothetical protein VE441_10985 [Mycobacterium sp.]|jgi:hypothetical protein|nr:hypothetical protein [Mycobacterium sp.]